MIQPTKDLLDLTNVTYEWNQFFGNNTMFVVGLLWFLVVLIYLVDTQIWYSINSSFIGVAVGLLWLSVFASVMQFNLLTRGTFPLDL